MNDSKEICPICEEGHLQHKVDSHSVDYHGQHANLDIHFSVCTACGSEQAGADELRKNKRIMIEFRKKVDGLLTGSQVRSIRKNLGLSQAEAARVFGGGPVAFSKYENDDVTQSEAMDKLLRLASRLPAAMDILQNPAHMIPDCQRSDEKSFTITSRFQWNRYLPQLNESGTAYGVDACKSGWFCIAIDLLGNFDAFIVERLEQLVVKASNEDRIFVDIPIGLPDGRDERLSDTEARRKLGQPRGSSVFRIPTRASLRAESKEEAKQINKSIAGKSLPEQTLAIMPKIIEVDELMRNSRKARNVVREVHPEICFWALAGGKPMKFSKKIQEGEKERIEVLSRILSQFGDISRHIQNKFRPNARIDDILDAMAAAVTASMSSKSLQTIPELPIRDSQDLPMEMVYFHNPAG